LFPSLSGAKIPIPVQLLGNKQNEYMDNHRNISVVGLSWWDPMRDKQVCKSLQGLLLKQPSFYRVDCAHPTNDIGKWNISTNENHYQDLLKWIDPKIINFFCNFSIPVASSPPLASSSTSQSLAGLDASTNIPASPQNPAYHHTCVPIHCASSA
jgi:hypothetical protein